jgi:hypothetical protein
MISWASTMLFARGDPGGGEAGLLWLAAGPVPALVGEIPLAPKGRQDVSIRGPNNLWQSPQIPKTTRLEDDVRTRGCEPAGTGLPARESSGVPFAPLPTSLILRFRPPSDISPAVPSPSLVAPADTFWLPGKGVVDRLALTEVLAPVRTFLTPFLRDDSFPLDSNSDRPGDPGRFLPFFKPSGPLDLPDGVLLPLELAPDGGLSRLPSLPLSFSLSLSLSLSFSLSASSESSSLCQGWLVATLQQRSDGTTHKTYRGV